jgi:hypothetical protein
VISKTIYFVHFYFALIGTHLPCEQGDKVKVDIEKNPFEETASGLRP